MNKISKDNYNKSRDNKANISRINKTNTRQPYN